MTCIAYDGLTIAADRGLTTCETYSEASKLLVVNGHAGNFIIALSGYWVFCEKIREYFQSKEKVEFPDCEKYETDRTTSTGLVIDECGGCHTLYGDGTIGGLLNQKWACGGSGTHFLSGALAAGASANDAIQLAIKYTTHAALGVDVLKISEVFPQ